MLIGTIEITNFMRITHNPIGLIFFVVYLVVRKSQGNWILNIMSLESVGKINQELLPSLTWACCKSLSYICMCPNVLLLICLTYWVVFQVQNLILTTFSMFPGISQGQTFATFSLHQPLKVWMTHQFPVLLTTEKSHIMTVSIK